MRSPEKEEELTQLDNILVTRLDVLENASIESAVREGIAKFGKLDVLLNNAGYSVSGLLEATPIEKIKRQFDVNVIGLLETTKAVIPHFRTNNSGIIINVSSVGGKIGFPLGTLYHGTKFAVEGLSEALSFEMLPIGVKVKIVEPGVIKTDLTGRSFDFNNDESLTEYQELVRKVFSVFGSLISSESVVVAEVIYQAATDGTDRLRYTAGSDAEEMIANRKAKDDRAFLESMKAMFGLE